MGTEVAWVPLVMSAVAAAGTAYNTHQTAKKQDHQLADSIRNQSKTQAKADAKVNEQVAELERSTANDERKQRFSDYMQTINQSSGKLTAGLNPTGGSEAFKADAAKAKADVQQGAADTAGLYARIDAPGMQRMNEGFGYGNLATDIGLLGRESKGNAFLDELRLRAIRRNPWIDMGAGVANGVAGAYGSGGGYGGNAGATAAGTSVVSSSTPGAGSAISAFRRGR